MRNKKQPEPETTPEQAALEQHVEAMMNPRSSKVEVRTPESVAPAQPAANSSSQPLDIFQGMPVEKVPLGPAKTAPMVPGKPIPKIDNVASKPTKSLFSSISDLDRSDSPSTPVAVAIKPKVTAPLGTPLGTPSTATRPMAVLKPTSLGSNPTTASAVSSGTALTVDKLARREDYNDAATDSAVADIVAKEGDDLLAAEDKVRGQVAAPVFKKPHRRGDRFKKIITSKWLLLIIPLILIALAAIPYTRYKLASLVIKKSLAITVIDSKTVKPVSGAIVDYNGQTTKTNTSGQATLQVPLGNGELTIRKGYYQTYHHKSTLGFSSAGTGLNVNLVATGRQVPLTIRNKITRLPIAGVTVKVLGTSAVSDKDGKLSIVLPTRTATATATLSANGYNTTTAEVQITDSVVAANSLNIVPSGSLYFLSDDSGKIDVIKTNLDGSDRKTVLAGTGHEDASTTSLVASHDWRYVVLQSHRDAAQGGLYLIDSNDDKVTQFDTSASTYKSIGWSGHTFVYDVVKSAQPQSQAGRESLKSYNADQQQLNLLDQSQATGDATSYGYQSYNNFFIIGSQLVYNTLWDTGGSTTYDLASQTDSIRTVTVAGTGKKDLQTYAASGDPTIQAAHTLPGTIAYQVAYSADAKTSYYAYANGSVTADGGVTAATFNKTYPLYLASPDATKNFWSDGTGSHQALMLGDKNATNPTTLASGGDYKAYGWYGSQYLLLSRGNSTLYVVPVSGISSNAAPLKIGDYVQSSTAPAGYGGGF